ncbi:MAG: hypothetical protein AAF531_22695 [Actinomycetota bacterium]
MARTVDDIPVAVTPAGGWTTWPAPILAGCDQPRVDGADDIDGFWRTVEVLVDGEAQPGHPALGRIQRIEQRADRVVVTGGRIIHDMRCDGTLDRGVHDVAEFDLSTEIHVVATYEDGVHVLRPDGMPGIEVRRRRDGDHLIWDYLGFTARLEHLAPSNTDPNDLPALAAEGA